MRWSSELSPVQECRNCKGIFSAFTEKCPYCNYVPSPNVEKIGSVIARFINKDSNQIEVKVYIKKHIFDEANLSICQKDLIDAGAIKTKGALRKAEKWMNDNKEFVLTQINKQLPSFWDEL